ncbi:MAG TPA: Zn-dependent hydrolase [Thermoanaerobaculia bacterium]|nr:Zn-dependent hydrolase [Thermoanaerobaculia bacterium]
MKRAAAVLLALLAFSATTYDPAKVAPDLAERVSRYKRVEMPFTYEGLSARERRLVDELIAASRDLENIYWRQNNPDDVALYNALAGNEDATAQLLRRYIWINGSRFDQIDENQPFYGSEPFPPGRALYPKGLTRDDIEAYVKAHPEQKDAIYDERTVVELVSREPLKLKTTPYHVKYRPWLTSAAAHLRAAAASSDDKAFASFLRERAKALLTDDYYASDLLWVGLQNPKFDIIFAPYETYLDNLLGVKTSYGTAVLVRNETESAKLAVFQKYVPDIQDALPLAAADRPSKAGHATPMEVMDAPFRAGDLRHGYQAAADNLPNDPRIHEKVGSKKIFFKNFMDARVNYVILPVAKLLMQPAEAAKASADGYLAAVMMHEISHGLGPSFARVDGKQVDIRQAIGPTYSGLEEAKADVTGMYGLQWLVDHGALPKERLEEYYASYVAGIFRTVRFGTAEAHGRAEMMEFNYLAERGAITRDAQGRYGIDYAKIPGALASLTKELLEIEATGDRARAETWFARYEKMPAELRAALERAKDVPVDIDPLVPFREGVR